MLRTFISSAIVLFLFISCNKDDDNNSVTPRPENPNVSLANPQISGQSVVASFTGIVKDMQGAAVVGALVSCGNKSTQTNERGIYLLEQASVDKDFALVTVRSNSHFTQFRNVKPQTGQINQANILMTTRTFSGAVNTESGGELGLPGGGKLVLPAGTYLSLDGSPYNGTINVISAYLDPTAADLSDFMPGSNLAVNSDGELQSLISYGMLGVELFGSSGPIQLPANTTATLEFPIQDEQIAYAPDLIQLWFFDENTGIWREEGEAQKQGNKYVGQVRHFTFWNCDYGTDWATIQGNIQLNGATPGSNWYLKLERPGGDYSTTSVQPNGFFDGNVPSGEVLAFSLYYYDGNCQEEITFDLGTIGPFAVSSSNDLGMTTATIPDTEIYTLHITAVLTDCDGVPHNGMMWYAFDTSGANASFTYTGENGEVDFTVYSCEPDIDLSYEAFLAPDFSTTGTVTIPFTLTGNDSFDFGNLIVCNGQFANGIAYQEGTNSNLFPFPFGWLGDCTYLQGSGNNSPSDSSAFFGSFEDITGPGVYSTCPSNTSSLNYIRSDGLWYTAVFTNITLNVTEYAANTQSVQTLAATYSGTVDVNIYADQNSEIPVSTYSAPAQGVIEINP